MEVRADSLDDAMEAAASRVALRRRARRDFIKGPIDWPWVLKAFEVGGRSGLLVGMALWRLRGLRKSGPIVWESTVKRQLKIHRRTRERCLQAFEAAGLVSVDRKPGRHPRIKLLLPELPTEGEADD